MICTPRFLTSLSAQNVLHTHGPFLSPKLSSMWSSMCMKLNLIFSCQYVSCWFEYLASQKNQRRESGRIWYPRSHTNFAAFAVPSAITAFLLPSTPHSKPSPMITLPMSTESQVTEITPNRIWLNENISGFTKVLTKSWWVHKVVNKHQFQPESIMP